VTCSSAVAADGRPVQRCAAAAARRAVSDCGSGGRQRDERLGLHERRQTAGLRQCLHVRQVSGGTRGVPAEQGDHRALVEVALHAGHRLPLRRIRQSGQAGRRHPVEQPLRLVDPGGDQQDVDGGLLRRTVAVARQRLLRLPAERVEVDDGHRRVEGGGDRDIPPHRRPHLGQWFPVTVDGRDGGTDGVGVGGVGRRVGPVQVPQPRQCVERPGGVRRVAQPAAQEVDPVGQLRGSPVPGRGEVCDSPGDLLQTAGQTGRSGLAPSDGAAQLIPPPGRPGDRGPGADPGAGPGAVTWAT
jgi:hypothetical protein